MERSLAERSGGGGAARFHYLRFDLSKPLLHRIRIFPMHGCLSAGGPCIPAGPDIHLLSKTPKSPPRRLSLCSLPVPKQFEESLGSSFSFAQSPNGGTWQPAHRNNPDVFPFLGSFSSRRHGSEHLGRHEILLPAVHRKKICNQFPGHCKRGPICVPSLSFLLVNLR